MSSSLFAANAHNQRRKNAEKRFKIYGLIAILSALAMLLILLGTILGNGVGAFRQTFVTLPVELIEKKIDKNGTRDLAQIAKVTTFGYDAILKSAMESHVKSQGIETKINSKDMAGILSDSAAAQVRDYVLANPDQIGTVVEFRFLANSRVDGYRKGRVTRENSAKDKSITDGQMDLIDALVEKGTITTSFNFDFLFGSDASDKRPEAAGFGVSMIGSFYMMLVVAGLALPIGVAASIYLEEFAPKNRLTDLIEVNIANLAAVPSIVFGILGLAIFIGWAELPRSTPIVGGLVLTLMTLPKIIIPARAALKAVPPSIRDAALGLGASKMQTIFHHILPLSMPGILTGAIIGLSQALGESAPLLLIGMVGYIATNYPQTFVDGFDTANSAMPAQIYRWSTGADPAFFERAWGGIIILLVFLVAMTLIAVILRRKFERRW